MHSTFSIASVEYSDRAASGKWINLLSHARTYHETRLQQSCLFQRKFQSNINVLPLQLVSFQPHMRRPPSQVTRAKISRCHSHQQTLHCMATIPASVELSNAVDPGGVANASIEVC